MTRPAPKPTVPPHHWNVWQDAYPWFHEHMWQVLAVVVGGLILARIAESAWKNHAALNTWRTRRSPKTKLTNRLRPILKHEDTTKRFIRPWTDVTQTGGQIGIHYPAKHHPTDNDITRIAALITAHIGGTWTPRNDAMHDLILYTRQPPPYTLPTQLNYTDLKQTPNKITIGRRADNTPLTWDLGYKAHAHALLAGMTGTGKTNGLLLILTEFARTGALIDIIDPKSEPTGKGDYDQLKHLPNIRVWDDDQDMLPVLTDFARDMDRRRRLPETLLNQQPVRVLLIDELYALARYADRHHKATRATKDAPNVILEEFERVARFCRAFRMRIVVGTQRPTVRDLGGPVNGPAIRRQLGFKIGLGDMGGDTDMMWSAQPPTVAEHNGRGLIRDGSTFVEVQLALINPADAVRAAAASDADWAGYDAGTGVGVGPYREVETVPLPEPAEPGPAELAEVEVECRNGHTFQTRAAESTRCPECRTPVRVPVGARQTVANGVARP